MLFILNSKLAWLGPSQLCLLAPHIPTWQVHSLPLRLPGRSCPYHLNSGNQFIRAATKQFASHCPQTPLKCLASLKTQSSCCPNQEATISYVESVNLFLRELQHLCLPPAEPIRKTNASYQEVMLNSVLLCLELLSKISQV